MSKEVVTQIRMTKEMKRLCKVRAERLGLTLSAWLRMKLLKVLEEGEDQV
jgi:antitoxin component of RelBE/YafQ-DinJ toxin-antitoxin module